MATLYQEFVRIVLFESLSIDDSNSILSTLRKKRFIQGQYIFDTGQNATCLYLLKRGLVKVSYISPEGDTKILDICEENDIFGELFLGDTRFRIGLAQAMTDCTAYMINEQDLFAIIQCYPQVGINFMRHLVNSHRQTIARMHALQRTDAKVRLLGTLLYLTRHMCCTDNQTFMLHPAISQQDLADMTGLNRSTVSSLINKLRQDDVLGGSGRELLLNKEVIEDILLEEGFELLK